MTQVDTTLQVVDDGTGESRPLRVSDLAVQGLSVRSGARPPTLADGAPGEFWVDTTDPADRVMYGPKAGTATTGNPTAWGTGLPLKGADGAAGAGGTSRTVTAQTTLVPADDVVVFDATGAAIAQALPDATTFSTRLTLTVASTAANAVTLVPATLVDGSSAAILLGPLLSGAPYQSVDLIPVGANWRIS